MKGIIDCNNFYCSCERLFKPHLKNKPVVVLSNNDGCIISLSDEAKQLGIKMASPYFMSKALIEQHNIATFSSNYNLYGDLSRRVMDTIKTILPEKSVEVYSVDEAFLDLSHIAPEYLHETANLIRRRVELWTGISVSIGIAPTKTLAKVANRLAKKDKVASNCVMVLDTEAAVADALQKTLVDDIWGVGHRSALKLQSIGIVDAWQLRQMPLEWARKNLGGVVGERLVRELNGESCIIMLDQIQEKKMISTTRMFGKQVTKLAYLQEAVSTYVSRAAEKLRRQQCAAKVISVFIVPKEEGEQVKYRHAPATTAYRILPSATSNTNELIKPAMQLLEEIFKKGQVYKKAGVTLSQLEPDAAIQPNLFVPASGSANKKLMDVLDNLNFSMRDDVVKFASSGLKQNWKMRQEMRSPRYTSRWEEIAIVR